MIICFMFILCGCASNNESSLNSDTLNEIKKTVENNAKLIEELNTKNKELESKILMLEEQKTKLETSLTKLETKNTAISTNLDTKYNELKTLINSKGTSNYTITKNQLLGTWKYGTSSQSITFTDENLVMHGNWFEWKGMAFYYIYKNGKLYISDDGYVLTK